MSDDPVVSSKAHQHTWIGIVGTLLGGILVELGIGFSLPVLGVAGIVLATGGLYGIDRGVKATVKDHRGTFLAIGLVLVIGGVALVVWAFQVVSVGLVAAGAGLAIVGWPFLRYATLGGGPKRARLWIVAGIALAALGLVAAGFGLLLDAKLPSVAGLGLIVIGIAVFRVGIREAFAGATNGTSTNVVIGGAASALVGILTITIGVYGRWAYPALLGVTLVVFGLFAFSLAWPAMTSKPLAWWQVLVIGLACIAAGIVFWKGLGPFDVAIVAFLILFGASFVVRREGYAAAVVIAFLFVWVLVDRTDHVPLDPYPTAPDRILALGDSYSSGEGSTVFFPGTNAAGDHPNQCRRSSTAYPYLIATHFKMGLDFYACSGAKAAEVWATAQMPDSPAGVPGGLPQLGNVTDTSRIRVVLISIGGNDALFGKIGKACVLPGTCAVFHDQWLANVARIGGDIERVYTEIKAKLPGVPVVAIPYPHILTPRGCGWSALERSEHAFLSEFITVLDDRVRAAAERAGVNFFTPGLFAFEGREICDGNGANDTDMNFFNLHPIEGSLLDRVNPANWVHGTFHPKPSGHRAIADRLIPWLQNLFDEIKAGGPSNPLPNPAAPFIIRTVSLDQTVLANPDDLPEDIACPVDEASPFASIRTLVHEQEGDEPTVALGADPDEAVCYTRPDGSWAVGPDNRVVVQDGTVSAHLEAPEDATQQLFIYKDTAGTWRQQIFVFCSRENGCLKDPDKWSRDQLAAAARARYANAVLFFLGGWLALLGVHTKLKG